MTGHDAWNTQSREQIAQLMAAAANLQTRTVLMTTYAAGLRVSEVCTL